MEYQKMYLVGEPMMRALIRAALSHDEDLVENVDEDGQMVMGVSLLEERVEKELSCFKQVLFTQTLADDFAIYEGGALETIVEGKDSSDEV